MTLGTKNLSHHFDEAQCAVVADPVVDAIGIFSAR